MIVQRQSLSIVFSLHIYLVFFPFNLICCVINQSLYFEGFVSILFNLLCYKPVAWYHKTLLQNLIVWPSTLVPVWKTYSWSCDAVLQPSSPPAATVVAGLVFCLAGNLWLTAGTWKRGFDLLQFPTGHHHIGFPP